MAIEIPVITTYNSTGIKKAQRDLSSFTGVLRKFGLARKLSLAGITTAAAVYAKQSIAAAVAEDKAQKKLLGTLQNIGKTFASGSVNDYIRRTEDLTNVTKEQLRPELQKLLRVTNTIGEAQDLLNTALNVSAGSSYSLSQVTTALAKAQTGNLTSLKKMTLGLDKATLETGNFYLIQEQLNKLFAGQASKSATGFTSDLAKISRAAGGAKEIIGKSLVVSIEGMINQAGGIDNVTNSMLNLATAIGKVVEVGGLAGRGIQTAIPDRNFLEKLADDFAQFGASLSGFGGGFRPLAAGAGRQAATGGFNLAARYSEDKRMANRVKELKIAQGVTRASATELRNQRQITANKKLAAKFDQDKIAIEAALKGKLSEEDRARLLALQALKSESKADDEQALKDLNELQKKNAAEEMARIKEGEAARSAAITREKQERQALQEWLKSNPMTVYTTSVVNGQNVVTPEGFGLPPTNSTQTPIPATNASSGLPTAPAPAGGGSPNVTVNVNAGTIADENKLTYIIADQIVKYVRFGGVTAPAGFI